MQFRERASLRSLEPARTSRVVCFRALQAPVVESAWRAFDAYLVARGGVLASGFLGAVARAFCDQCVLAPPSIAAFFVTQSLLEGRSVAESIDRVRTSFMPAYIVAFPLWMCAHTVTFGLVPAHRRMAWASTVAVFWNAFLSGRNEIAKTAQEPLDK